MRDDPDGAALLAAAEQALRDEVLSQAAPAQRSTLLMVCNALRIAMRQLQRGDAAVVPELSSLATLGLWAGDTAADAAQQLVQANGRLCADIRAGRFDASVRRAQVWSHLTTVARERVGESNPKYLA